MSDMERDCREYERQDLLISINVYAERLEGSVVVWLAISRQDGTYTAMTFAPPDVDLLIDALTKAREQAEDLRR